MVPALSDIEAEDRAAVGRVFVAAVEVAVVLGVHGEVGCALGEGCEDGVIPEIGGGGFEVAG